MIKIPAHRLTTRTYQPGSPRVPRIRYVAALAIFAWAAGLSFAAFGPSDRASAVASTLVALASASAALTALFLSRESLSRTDEQLANAHRTLVLSRYPILIPVHQSASYPETSGQLAEHPPTAERFRLTGASAGTYAFVQTTNNRCLLPVENAGEGPALEVDGTLWSADGRRAELQGTSTIGARRTVVLTGVFSPTIERAPERLAECRTSHGAPPRFLVELTYTDVFGNSYTASAVFDPDGLGAWRKLRVTGLASLRNIPGAAS